MRLPGRQLLFYGDCMMYRAVSRVFAVLLALLVASFFFVPEQHQRNWLLYLAAATAHLFLLHGSTVKGAFAGSCGWAVPGLLAVPLLSLAWSGPVAGEIAADLLLAAWCVLLIYLGVAHLVRQSPLAIERLRQTLLLGANLGALISLVHWAAGYDAGFPRLPGALGLDNPVHGSVLLLAATLPVWIRFAEGSVRPWWLLAVAAPCAFALLAGSRTALAAYIVMVAFLLRPRFRPRAMATGILVLVVASAAAIFGSDTLRAIWLDRGLSYRPEIWGQAWAAWLACNPLIGCGVAAPLEVEYLPGIVTGRAHSLYVAALYHQGIVGAAVFLGISLWLLFRAGDDPFVIDEARGLAPTPIIPNSPQSPERPPGTQDRQDEGRGDLATDGSAPATIRVRRRDWATMLAYVLLASATSGDHILVRTTLFWCYFWLPVMVLAASGSALASASAWAPASAPRVSERGNSPADPA